METHVLMVPGVHMVRVFNRIDEVVEQRLASALKLWYGGEYSHLLLSGGFVAPWKTQTMSEAALMRDWLSIKGVSEASVILEESSVDTLESIRKTFWLLKQRFSGGVPPMTLVSHPDHIVQCRAIILSQEYADSDVRYKFVLTQDPAKACVA